MPSLFDIGRSGLQAYKQSLAVAGQNIANVNTEGYKKRDAALAEVSGAGGGVTEVSDQTGLGVRVEEIRRAFDEFLLDKARQASSLFEKADSYLDQVQDLENLLLPGDQNLSNAMGNFFNALQEVASAPDDQAPRIVLNEKGKDVASQFNLYADRIERLKFTTENRAKDAVTSVNLLTSQLASINEDLLTSGLTSQSSNAKLDQRDKLIDQLSQVAQVSVSYGSKGEALIRLGNSGSGPIILEKVSNVTIDTMTKSGRLQPVVGLNKVATNQIQGGILSGLVDSYSMADDTIKEIDNLAILFSQKFNEINKNGLTLDGVSGKDMFATTSLEAIANPTNRTTVGVEIIVNDPTQIIKDTYNLEYSQSSESWNLTGNSLNSTVSGKNNLEGLGFTISIFGSALDGDSFTLSPVNESKGMQYLLTRPQDIAGAKNTLISSDSSNLGTSILSEISLIASVDKTTLNNIDAVFSNGQSPVTATEFSTDGGLAIIPAGTSEVNLSSYIDQPEVKFSLSSSDITSLTNISLTLSGGSSLTVDLTGAASIEEVADILNSSRDVNGTAHTFRSLGLFASGGASTLTIASNDKDFSAATVSSSGTINGVITNPTVVTASNIQIFTREGRHLSGTALSSSEIATHMTQDNGFNASAEYRADYINGNDADGYRGIQLDRSTVSGNHVISYGANGTALSSQRAATDVPSSHVSSAYTLTVTSSNAGSVDISVPINSSAGYVSGLINSSANNLGIRASAITRIKIPAPSSNGTISFNLKSKSGTNSTASISASILTTDLTNLATIINDYSGKTGVKANLSIDKKSVILENVDGDDIEISSFTSPSSLAINLLKDDYSDSGSSVTLDSSSYKAARFSGELSLESSISFSTSNDSGSTTVSSAQDALEDGYYVVTSSSSGETKTIVPRVFDGDISASHPDGVNASSSVLSYGLTLPATATGSSFTTTIDASELSEISTNIISKKIAEGLRASSPSIEIEGNSIATIPEDGSSFQINHDGLTYTLTMSNGEILVSGGEADLISAYFNDRESLTIDTSSFSNATTITSTEHGLKTGDSITYNAAEKAIVDTTNFNSTTNITFNSHGFTTADPIVYKANGSSAINGLTDGTTYYAVVSDSNTFALATSSSNANNGTTFSITGGSGGSLTDSFTSPINGLVDGTDYYVVKTDNHNFKLSATYELATNSSPTTLTITGGAGGNSSDTFDPGKNLYLSAGKTISASQFSFANDTTNNTNALSFGMSDSNITTTITSSSIATPSGSDSSHFHISLDEYSSSIGVFVRTNSKTINTSSISSSSTTLTSSSHGFKTGDKILYTAASSNLNGLTTGTSYFVKVVDANTFSLASTFANATNESPTLLSFGGSGGNSSDTFATVYAEAYIGDDISTPTTAASIGITAEINQISDSNAQISIIKEADKNSIVLDNEAAGYGASSESYGFKTNLTQMNVINDSIKLTSIGSSGYGTPETKAVDFSIPSNSTKSLSGNNISLTNLPPEDLVVIITGDGAKKISANYGETSPPINSSEYRFVVDSTNSDKIEILEAGTLNSIATRTIPTDGVFSAVDRSFKITGESKVNDIFHISNNTSGIGDNRNILDMIALQEADITGINSGSFQDIFNATLTEIGSSVRSGEMTLESAQSSRDASKALEDERSGVSMDEEASALIEFQQAYSANARIIQTARELFDSLLSVIRS